ncbi:hypothetical protein F4808DRAFT_189648 [Astrocystis sublimbata]|nr:hypothetical protein F4808DRAFT_189648 [Astrocystis sublimbata]
MRRRTRGPSPILFFFFLQGFPSTIVRSESSEDRVRPLPGLGSFVGPVLALLLKRNRERDFCAAGVLSRAAAYVVLLSFPTLWVGSGALLATARTGWGGVMFTFLAGEAEGGEEGEVGRFPAEVPPLASSSRDVEIASTTFLAHRRCAGPMKAGTDSAKSTASVVADMTSL